MQRILIKIEDSDENELKDLTSSKDTATAVARAIKFTLLHDKDSVKEALK